MPPYYGLNTSLYYSIDTNAIQHLEQAIVLTERGAYTEAQCIFDEALAFERLTPVVILARAELALKQLKVGLLYRLLDEALGRASESLQDGTLDMAEYRLMGLMRAFGALLHKGIIDPALDEIHRAQRWLQDLPVSEYTDIQVNFVRRYVLLVLYVSLDSNYIGDEAAMIPKPTSERVEWQGLTDLRLSLLERGMLGEALALFKVERSRLPPIERADAALLFLDHVKTRTSLSEDRATWVQAELTIYVAQGFFEKRETEIGEVEFRKAEELLDAWVALTGHPSKDHLSLYLDIQLLRLQYDAHDDSLAYFDVSVKLLEVMKACHHTSTSVCYGHAIAAANALDMSGISDPYRSIFFKLHLEREHFQEFVLEDIRTLLSDHGTKFLDSTNNVADVRKALEWLDGFSEKYKQFNLPIGLSQMNRWRRLAYKRLGDREREKQAEAEVESLKPSIPTNMGRLVGVRQSKSAHTNLSSAPESKAEAAFPLDLAEDNFYMEWYDSAGNSEAKKATAMRVLLRWMLADITKERLSEQEVLSILGDTKGGMDVAVIDKLELLSPEDVFALLYLQNRDSQSVPIDADVWNARAAALDLWLSRTAESPFNGRQHLRLVLQEIRKDSVSKSQLPLNTKISEIERCLAMIDEMPPRVKEHVLGATPGWQGGIADQCMLYVIQSEEFDSLEVGSALDRALYECRQSICGYKAQGEVLCLAMRRRMVAELCVFKIQWILRRPEKNSLDSELDFLQNEGLRCLEEADAFFTLRHEEFTWSSNFEGLEDRERATLLENSWRIPQIAVQLLNSSKKQPSDDIREQIWKWVQRSKARSLAVTTGVGGTIPSALLRQFMLSDVCRALYERMILLQEQIQAAPLQERFALRQQLDLHKLSMRKEELLREFLDLKDGKTLNSFDIDRIAGISDTPFVLVDWFHVPGVLDDGEFLLLIKRPGSAATVSTLETTSQQAAKWVDLYLDRPSSKLRTKLTGDICGLVQPLTNLTQPGELMVFCPTALLHRIPLHAIEVNANEYVGWKPLIHRNPVLFIHSHSLLRVCHWNSQMSAEMMAPLCPLVMNGIPDKAGNEAFGHGRDSVKMLAAQLGTLARLNEQATKSKFVELAPNSRLIHVHSHVYWDAADPRAHHINFSDSDAEAGSGKLTTREVFALPLSKGCHVSLMACSGGRARVGSGDEVMGLIPALLHSGASSTISTLWNIPDEIGANFTGAFYRSFLEESRTVPAGGFINIARIFQSAVKELDKDEKDTVLHWTSFILHGFWLFFVPAPDAKPLA
ncbi:hypothetical protein MMC26_002177 [Xylographa opegraphella]|nr:hypothetical protein [Xylographa opegraphella]